MAASGAGTGPPPGAVTRGPATLGGHAGARLYLTWPRALIVLAALMLALGGRGADFLLVVLGAIAWIATRAVDAAARGLAVGYRVIDHHIFLGGTARVAVTVANRSRWPVPLLLVQIRLPEGLPGAFRRILTLGPRANRRFAFRVSGLQRGVYRLGDTRVVLADWFGLREDQADAPVRARLVVYPAILPLPTIIPVHRLPSGPRRHPGSPFRDDLPIGVRPYVRGDPWRSIAWKATARRGDFLVREMPPVLETATWLFLDLDTADWDPLLLHELTERAIAVAGSLLWREQKARHAVGLSAWGAFAERSVHGQEAERAAWIRLPPSLGQPHALRALEALAAIRPAPGGAFAERVRAECDHLPWGSHVRALVPRDTPDLWRLGAALAARGHPVSLWVFERRLGQPSGLRGGRLPQVFEVEVRDGVTIR